MPLAEMFGYINFLRSATSGRGTFTMEFDHYAGSAGQHGREADGEGGEVASSFKRPAGDQESREPGERSPGFLLAGAASTDGHGRWHRLAHQPPEPSHAQAGFQFLVTACYLDTARAGSANALKSATSSAAALAQQQYGKPVAELDADANGPRYAREVAVTLKTNRFDAASNTLHLTAAGSRGVSPAGRPLDAYFHDPVKNGGLKPDLITDPAELHQLTAFITWAAWASVANRPGSDYSYTNNFPYDPEVGNVAPPGALLWSALSLVVLLGGIGAVLLAFGKFDYLGWVTRGHHVHRR